MTDTRTSGAGVFLFSFFVYILIIYRISHHETSLLSSTKGASATEYGILIGLIGAISIGVILATGLTVNESFETTNQSLVSAQEIADNGTGNDNNGGGNGNNPGNQPCFVEDGGDSNNFFEADDTNVCFEISNGNDSLEVLRDGLLTVTLANGFKSVELGGTGPQNITVTNVDGGEIDGTNVNMVAQDSNLIVNTTGLLDLIARGSSPSNWEINTSNDADIVQFLEGAMPGDISLSGGNDALTFTSPAGWRDFPNITLGAGTNTGTFSCTDGSLDFVSTGLPSIAVIGQDSYTSTSCPLSLSLPSIDPATGSPVAGPASLSLSMPSSSAYLAIDQRNAFSSLSVTGNVAASGTFFFDVLNTVQQGPLTLDLTVTPDHTSPGPQGPHYVASVRVAADIDAAAVGPDIPSTSPTSISFDTQPMEGTGLDTYIAIALDRPTPQQSVTITGTAPGTRNLLLQLPDPDLVPNTGVPPLSVATPVEMTVLMDTCGAFTIHAKAGSGRSDINVSQTNCEANDFQPVNNIAFDSEVQYYEGITVTHPSGGTHQIGFNGGSFANGATLTLDSLRIGISTREDFNSGGGGGN